MNNHFTNADADRLLGFADQFIKDMELDVDERASLEEYRQIRPLFAAAPQMLNALQSVETLIHLELKAEPGTGLCRALRDIQAAIAEAQPVMSKKQELADRILAVLPFSSVNPGPLAQAIIGEVTQFFYDPDRAIAHVWSIEDVQFVRTDLDDTQALQVLRHIEAHHNSQSGLSWSGLEMWADELFPPSENASDQQ
jgi:hypothetical protein